jgi:hypothetical protein
VTRLLIDSEANFDVKLARKAVAWSACPEMVRRIIRAVEILAETTVNSRINPIIVQLSRSKDNTIRSKVRAVLARGCPNPANVDRWIDDPDPRVRANVIEMLGLSASNSAWVRELLAKYAGDRNNRIAANALVGLFRFGERESAIAGVLRMAADQRAPFRGSAAWAMGEMPDRGLKGELERLRHDCDSIVRWNALRSLVRLRKRANDMQAEVVA